MSTQLLTTQLDKFESNLPTVSARIFRLQRTLAGAAFDRTAAVVTTVAESTRNFLDTARISGKTVTGQARAAGEDLLTTTRSGVRSVADQAQSVAADVTTSARTGARTVRGQAGAQGKKVSKAATSNTTKLIDTAIDAVDAVDDKPGSGQPYEQWTKAELLERAQELDIDGRSSLNKKQLIAALRAA